MSLHKLTAGDGYTYLTRQVAAGDATNRGYSDLAAYYSEKGEAPGVWMGSGLSSLTDFPLTGYVTEAQMKALFGQGRHPNAAAIEQAARAAGKDHSEVKAASQLGNPYRVYEQVNMFYRRSAGAFRDYNTGQGLHADTPVPVEVRARVRSDIAAKMFTETYGRDPVDARELSGQLARISRQATTAVAGYDLTFSPVKSVSTLWAIAPREVAAVIEQAHRDAVKDTISWLEENATYTRRGKAGVAQVEVQGLIAAAFTHRDSRAGDPDLHTHVAVSNKVQAKGDGQWLALDGRAFFKNNVAASERYNTRLEGLLVDRLGVRFADRPSTDPSKRPIREIVGVDGDLPRYWSKRRASIDVRRASLSAQFQRDHGRPPTANEARELAQRANLETRQRKHEPRAYAEQRAAWRAEAVAVLGGEAGLRDYVWRALHPPGPPQRQRITARWLEETAYQVLAAVQSSRAVWQENHVRAEAERRVRAAGIPLGEVDRAVNAVISRALSPELSLPLDSVEPVSEPAALRRSDGTSVYTVAGSTLYTSAEIIAAEQAIVAAAARKDGRTISARTIDLAILESAANGVELNPGQVRLVRELSTSGARVQLALAPAGTGKTTAMRVLARAWTADGGSVVGLAPSAAAAAVLREELSGPGAPSSTDTLAKLIHCLRTGIGVPDWVPAIGPDTLVVIDEAGMAGTSDLAEAIEYVLDRGGSVRLIGDDQQLAAIGAGGVLRDICEVHGAVTLSQVMRFTDPVTGAANHAEGAASLALRDGDSAAIAYYTDNNRIHVGDLSTATSDAYTAWSVDRAAGRDSIMLAPTRDLVTELNDRARRDRLATQPGPLGRQVILVDQTQASAGDAIITRQNNRKIPIGAHDWVKNGDRWIIEQVRESGALDVLHRDTGRHITLPAGYVAEHVSLGYASTVHGAQGITADTCHTIATGQESRQLLYVAITRGRHTNHVYLSTAGNGDEHAVITRDALLPPTAVDILTGMLARDGAPVSAASHARSLADPATRLAAAADRYYDSLHTAAIDYLKREHGQAAMSRIDSAAEAALPGLTRHDAYPTLRAHLALCAVAGHDPADLLRQALSTDRGLSDAHDVAAVLDWRLDPTGRRSNATGRNGPPLSWLPAVPEVLAADHEWGAYLHDRSDLVIAAAGDVAARARTWTPTNAPSWALPIIDRNPTLAADLAVWREAHDVPDTDRRPTGPPLPAAADARAQRALDQRVTRLLGHPRAATARWKPLADRITERIAADPYWPTLADRLTDAERAGIDITSLTHAVAGESPLPDEQPAAALWWRLSRHLSPAVTAPTQQPVPDTLRPGWAPGTLPDADAYLDGDWLPSLTAPEPGEQEAEALSREALTPARHDAPLRYVTDLEQDPVAAVHAALAAQDEARDFARADHEHFWGTAAVPRARLIELNRLAEDFFTDHYHDAWAPTYLSERLGTDLTDHARFSVGYAPGRWTALTDHLRRQGATDEEIVGSGLGRVASTGRLIDHFRDRLVFPIKDTNTDGDPEILGWIGRRNPAHDRDDGQSRNAGPKYLNTAETDLFRKGNELYGLVEATSALAGGAAVVLVEGPMDAIAVTLAGNGNFVGVAPLGTAFTDTQADKLRPHIGVGRPDPIIATDADVAGQQAAHRAFWQLTARGASPQHLVITDGKDPADMLHTTGPEALHTALSSPTGLAGAVIAARLSEHTDRLDTVEGRVHAARRAAEVIAALPDGWIEHIDHLVDETGVSKQTAIFEVIDAVEARTAAPRKLAKRHLAERSPVLLNPEPASGSTPTSAPADDLPSAQRWAALVKSVLARASRAADQATADPRRTPAALVEPDRASPASAPKSVHSRRGPRR
jgi:DNA primase catalytic core